MSLPRFLLWVLLGTFGFGALFLAIGAGAIYWALGDSNPQTPAYWLILIGLLMVGVASWKSMLATAIVLALLVAAIRAGTRASS